MLAFPFSFSCVYGIIDARGGAINKRRSRRSKAQGTRQERKGANNDRGGKGSGKGSPQAVQKAMGKEQPRKGEGAAGKVLGKAGSSAGRTGEPGTGRNGGRAMQNAVLTEAENAIRAAWQFSNCSRESIEGQLKGAVIVAVYPLLGMDGNGDTYCGGLSIVYQPQGSSDLQTVDITTQNCCSRDDDVLFNKY